MMDLDFFIAGKFKEWAVQGIVAQLLYNKVQGELLHAVQRAAVRHRRNNNKQKHLQASEHLSLTLTTGLSPDVYSSGDSVHVSLRSDQPLSLYPHKT